nr:helix-turn-helix domain-containing protein [uncultured Marvinbryantia sp.]
MIRKILKQVIDMELAEKIRKIREQTGLSRKDFSIHIGIPLRTIEDWEAGRRRPPEYIPRLIEYQIKYEEMIEKRRKEEKDAEK